MIISVHELNEHDNLHFSGDFSFGGNCKCFLVISLVITGENRSGTRYENYPILYRKNIQFYMILGSLG